MAVRANVTVPYTDAENPTKERPQAPLAKIDERTVCTTAQLAKLFESAIPRIEKALPPTMKRHAERLARCAVTEFQKNQSLAKCTGLSILSCCLQAATLGLEIGGTMGQAYMVPYGNQATFQIGYRGMIKLAFNSGEIANLYACVVRQKDKFRILRGTSPGIEHEPMAVGGGDVIGAYAVCVYRSGLINFEYMSRDEIEHHRKTYSKQPNSLLWTSAWNEGAKKTVLRRLLKQVPMAADVFSVPDLDEGEAVTVAAVPVPAIETTPEVSPDDDGVNEPGRQGSLIDDSVTDTSAQAR